MLVCSSNLSCKCKQKRHCQVNPWGNQPLLPPLLSAPFSLLARLEGRAREFFSQALFPENIVQGRKEEIKSNTVLFASIYGKPVRWHYMSGFQPCKQAFWEHTKVQNTIT